MFIKRRALSLAEMEQQLGGLEQESAILLSEMGVIFAERPVGMSARTTEAQRREVVRLQAKTKAVRAQLSENREHATALRVGEDILPHPDTMGPSEERQLEAILAVVQQHVSREKLRLRRMRRRLEAYLQSSCPSLRIVFLLSWMRGQRRDLDAALGRLDKATQRLGRAAADFVASSPVHLAADLARYFQRHSEALATFRQQYLEKLNEVKRFHHELASLSRIASYQEAQVQARLRGGRRVAPTKTFRNALPQTGPNFLAAWNRATARMRQQLEPIQLAAQRPRQLTALQTRFLSKINGDWRAYEAEAATIVQIARSERQGINPAVLYWCEELVVSSRALLTSGVQYHLASFWAQRAASLQPPLRRPTLKAVAEFYATQVALLNQKMRRYRAHERQLQRRFDLIEVKAEQRLALQGGSQQLEALQQQINRWVRIDALLPIDQLTQLATTPVGIWPLADSEQLKAQAQQVFGDLVLEESDLYHRVKARTQGQASR